MAQTQTSTPQAAPGTVDGAALLQTMLAEDPKLQGKLGKVFDRKADELNPILDSIGTLLNNLLKGKIVSKDVVKCIEGAISHLTKLLSDQINAVIHHPDFTRLEGAWRGLAYLVKNTPADPKMLKICVLNISKEELGDVLGQYDAETGARGWDQSPIHKHIFENRFDTPGGEPFGCLVGDYQFSHLPQDVDILSRLSRICGAAHVPFISAAEPRIFGMKSWQDLSKPWSLEEKMATVDYAKWNSFRASEDSRYVALTAPRFLARLPYGENTNKVKAFAFEEDLRPDDPEKSSHDNYVWSNAAYAMAVNIARSFDETSFCVRIRGKESGVLVEGLPIHTFPTDDGRRAQENAALSARLPYIFLCSRFAHYLKKMLYDQVGSFKEGPQIEAELNKWISQYTSDPSSAQDVKARKPLAEARIVVHELEGKPGYYAAEAFLRPHIQLEGVTVKLGVVARMPGGGGD